MQITIPDEEDADIYRFATNRSSHILHVAFGGEIWLGAGGGFAEGPAE